VEVIDYLHAPVSSPTGKEHPLPIGEEAGLAPVAVIKKYYRSSFVLVPRADRERDKFRTILLKRTSIREEKIKTEESNGQL
jgi:hypothetical protein